MTRSRLAAAVLVCAAVRAAAAGLPVAAPSAAPILTRIGVAAAVSGAVKAEAPGAKVGRVVGSGQPVFLNDHVKTGPDGRLQILLLDETSFTLGPNADMVLDEFVYDPSSHAGKISARILKGAFRFLTGKIAQRKAENMKVGLSVATIGIRGTMVAGFVSEANADVVLVGPGAHNETQDHPGGITVFNGHGSVDIASSGFGTSIHDGGAPSGPTRFTPEQLEQILGQLSPHHGGNGGGGPTDVTGASGHGSALGGLNLRDWLSQGNLVTQLGQTSTFASQQIGDPASTWADVINIQSGSAGYQGNGTFSCAGSGCANIGGNTGNFSFTFNVDFGAKILGSNAINNGTIQVGSDSMTFQPISYANLTGKAAYTLTSADISAGLYGSAAGTAIQFLKQNGSAAGGAQVNLLYNLNSNGGTATGTARAVAGPPIPGG